jgi:hypothetical protein
VESTFSWHSFYNWKVRLRGVSWSKHLSKNYEPCSYCGSKLLRGCPDPPNYSPAACHENSHSLILNGL